jgi:hypothetical protein
MAIRLIEMMTVNLENVFSLNPSIRTVFSQGVAAGIISTNPIDVPVQDYWRNG